MDQRRLLCARTGGARVHRGRPDVLGGRPARTLGSRWPASGLSPRRLLAGDGYPARQESARRAVAIREGPVESVGVTQFGDAYRGRRVLLTGHTGFKGSWLALWLTELGADVTGVSLPPP